MPVSHSGLYSGLGSRAIIGTFYRRYEEDLAMAWAPEVSFFNGDANQETETYRFLGAAPFPREWIGGRNLQQKEVNEIQITNRTYEATEQVAVDDLRRDKTGQIMARISELALGFADHWNDLVNSLMEDNGTSGVYDGQNFYDTDHSIGDSGTINNAVTATQVGALNVSDTSAPTQTEMASIIIGLVQHIYTFKNERGQPANGTARQFGLIVPPKYYGAAIGAARAERLDNGQSNILLEQEFRIVPKVNPRFTAANLYVYLCRMDGPVAPFILQEEAGVRMEVVGMGSEHEFKHNEHLYGAKATRSAGYGDFLYTLRGTLS